VITARGSVALRMLPPPISDPKCLTRQSREAKGLLK
jgi:hypothetical protein